MKWIKINNVPYVSKNQELERLGIDNESDTYFSWALLPFLPEFMAIYPVLDSFGKLNDKMVNLVLDETSFVIKKHISELITELADFEDNKKLIYEVEQVTEEEE